MTDPATQWLSPEDIAEQLNISVRSARRLLTDGKLAYVQLTGRTRRVHPADLVLYIALNAHVPCGSKGWTDCD